MANTRGTATDIGKTRKSIISMKMASAVPVAIPPPRITGSRRSPGNNQATTPAPPIAGSSAASATGMYSKSADKSFRDRG